MIVYQEKYPLVVVEDVINDMCEGAIASMRTIVGETKKFP